MATIKPMSDALQSLYDAETPDEVQSAIQQGAGVNEIADTYGMSPLHLVCATGPADVLRAMLDQGADLEAKVPTNVTLVPDPRFTDGDGGQMEAQYDYDRMAGKRPLDIAIDTMQPDLTRELLNAGASVLRPERETQVLHNALRWHGENAVENIKLVLDQGGDPNQPDGTPRSHKETALHVAVNEGHGTDVVQELLNHGAHVDAHDSRGRTPLVNAILTDNADAAGVLMANGANTSHALENQAIADRSWSRHRNSMGTLKAVHEADGERNRSTVWIIDTYGGERIKEEPQNPAIQALLDTPYESSEPYVPTQEDRERSKRLILDGVKRRDLSAIDREVEDVGKDILNETYAHGQSLLGAAAWSDYKASGSPPLLPRILQMGTDPNVCNEDGVPALVEIAGYKRTDIIKPLLDAGADVNGVNPKTGRTALYEACTVGETTKADLAQMLLDHGARHDVVDHEGNTPLALAATQSSPVVANTLMKRGADVKVAMQCPVWKETESLPSNDLWDYQKDAMSLVRKTAVEQEKQALRQAATEVEQAQPAHEKPAARVRMRM